MRIVLRITAVLWIAWAVLLLGFAEAVVPPVWLTPAGSSAVAMVGAAHLVLAALLWHGSGEPGAHRGVVYATIVILAMRWAADSYGVLNVLPARPAMFALGDLIVTVALLVGVLESLPRMLAPAVNPPTRR